MAPMLESSGLAAIVTEQTYDLAANRWNCGRRLDGWNSRCHRYRGFALGGRRFSATNRKAIQTIVADTGQTAINRRII